MHRNEGENMTSGALFPTFPPYGVLTPEFMNAVQEELMAVIENAGLPILSKSNDTRNQILTAIQRLGQSYDYYVASQASFVALFERTGANTYSIKGDYDSVYFKKVIGGYSVSAILSGGDTWGDLYTNACEHLEFENGAYINFGALKGNLTVNTDGCYVHNADVRGNGGSGAIVESFKLGASRVTFDNCKCNTRLSSVDMVGFQGSGTALHNITSKYINCSAYSLDGADKLYGFKDCMNLQNCLAYDLDNSSGTDLCAGFHTCSQISSCNASSLNSNQITSGFHTCSQISSCNASSLDSVSITHGFNSCNQISSCLVDNINSDGTAVGFNSCHQISSCLSSNITGSAASYGFSSCVYGAALFTDEVANTSNDWMNTDDAQITNKFSVPAVFT